MIFCWYFCDFLPSLFSLFSLPEFRSTEKLQGCNRSLHCVVLYFSLCPHLWPHLWPNLVAKLPQHWLLEDKKTKSWSSLAPAERRRLQQKWQHLRSPRQRMASMSSKERCSWLSRRWDGVQDGRPIFPRSVGECSKLVLKDELVKWLAMLVIKSRDNINQFRIKWSRQQQKKTPHPQDC